MRMLIEAVLRAAHILRAQPGYTMPLSRLYAQLVQELGSEAGSYSQIYQQLQKRTDSFTLLNSPRVLAAADGWSGMVREAYSEALQQAGLGSCVRVALTEAAAEDSNNDLAAALSATVGELVMLCGKDVALAAYVERASHELTELGRVLVSAGTSLPTTHPPDPPPAV